MRISCFGITLDSLSLNQALAQLQLFLKDGRQHYIVTPNPEMIILAEHDEVFASVLRAADLAPVDGVGLVVAAQLMSGVRVRRLSGTDLLEAMLRLPFSFFLLGGENGVAEKMKKKVSERFGTKVEGVLEPKRGTYEFKKNIEIRDYDEHARIVSSIKKVSPDIIIVALGHNLQEKWIAEFQKEFPSVRLAMGVGGAFDYLSGSVTRAPKFVRRIGLEWLWRLVRQPQRIQRIWTATVLFSLLAIRWIGRSRFLYRPMAVSVVVNPKGEILIVERMGEPGHWQLPQGGRERGESLEQTCRRELGEELSLRSLRFLGESKPNIYRYTWPRVVEASSRRHYGYRGQAASIAYFSFTGTDSEIHVDNIEHTAWQWVPLNTIMTTIHPVRHTLTALALAGLKNIHV